MPRQYGITNLAPWASAPAVGLVGDVYYDTVNKQMFISDGTFWIPSNYYICTSTTRPTQGLINGLLIYEQDTTRIYRWNGSAWIYQMGGNNPTACRVTSSVATVLTLSAWVKINYGVVSWDYGSCFDLTNDNYTVASAGPYKISARQSTVGSSSGERFIMSLFINNVEGLRGSDFTQTGTATGPVGLLLSGETMVNAGDVLDIRIQQQNGVARQTEVSGNTSYFNLRRIYN